MSALDITAARISTRIRHNYAGELVRILRFKWRGIATGISNYARRRERSAAYSNGISLGSFNHWHYSNPDNCRCSGHCRAACRAFITNIMSRGAPELVPWGVSGTTWSLEKILALTGTIFFRASRPGHTRSIRDPEFFILKWTYGLRTPGHSLDG